MPVQEPILEFKGSRLCILEEDRKEFCENYIQKFCEIIYRFDDRKEYKNTNFRIHIKYMIN